MSAHLSPLRDPVLADVDDGHPDVRALEGDHGHGRAADVSGADAADAARLGGRGLVGMLGTLGIGAGGHCRISLAAEMLTATDSALA